MEKLSKEDALILAIPWMHRMFTMFLHANKVNVENYKEHISQEECVLRQYLEVQLVL